MFALTATNREGDLNTQKLLQSRSLPQTVHEYLQRVQAITWNRRIFVARLEDQTDLMPVTGLGPSDASPGDLACILLGCSVPVILREVSMFGSSVAYELVGETYMHGFMDGEAIIDAEREDGQKSYVDFTDFRLV